MGDWRDFFVAEAGAAGGLTGLLFAGVTMNLERNLLEPGWGLKGHVPDALILLMAVLTTSSLLLVPGKGRALVGTEVLVAGIAARA